MATVVRVAVTATVAASPTGTVTSQPVAVPPGQVHTTWPAPSGTSFTTACVAVWPVTSTRCPVLVVVRASTCPPGGGAAGIATTRRPLITEITRVSSWLPASVTLTESSIVPVAGSRIVRRSRVVGSAPSTFTSYRYGARPPPAVT